MTDRWPAVISILVAAVLQVGLAPNLAISGIVPNFMILVVVTLAFVQGPTAGTVAGFSAGLLLDLLGSGPIGLWALVLCIIGYVSGMLESKMFARGWVLPVTVVFLAVFGAEAGYGLAQSIVGVETVFSEAMLQVVLPGAIYNTVLAILVYPWLARILRRDPEVAVMSQLR